MCKKLTMFFICFIFIVFLGREGSVSEISFHEIPLDRLVIISDVIVMARKLPGFTKTKEIPIAENSKEYPPFTTITYNFMVIEELSRVEGIRNLNGKPINVCAANYAQELKLHKQYYLQGIGESPVYLKYPSTADFDKADTLILFLCRLDQKDFVFAVENAYEAVSRKSEILKLIKELK